EPRAPARDARLRNRRAAPVARLALASVNLELVLHRARPAVRERIVPEGGALASDSRLESGADAAGQTAQLVPVEAFGGAQRMDLRAPKRLVHVDVSHAGERALVEEGRLDGRPPCGKALAESRGGEERVEWLLADANVEVGLELARLEQQPGAEAPDVAVRDVRSVI